MYTCEIHVTLSYKNYNIYITLQSFYMCCVSGCLLFLEFMALYVYVHNAFRCVHMGRPTMACLIRNEFIQTLYNNCNLNTRQITFNLRFSICRIWVTFFKVPVSACLVETRKKQEIGDRSFFFVVWVTVPWPNNIICEKILYRCATQLSFSILILVCICANFVDEYTFDTCVNLFYTIFTAASM